MLIGKQYHHMVKQQDGVLTDSDRAMANWEAVRHKYLAADLRHHLHQQDLRKT